MISNKVHELCINAAWKEFWAKIPGLYKDNMTLTQKTTINESLTRMMYAYKANLETILRSKGVNLEPMEYSL